MAGLWERWEGDGKPLETCTLLTTDANELLAGYHDRMPVIVSPEDYDFRWVQRYAPEINKRARPHLKMSGTSYRVDETYIEVGKACKYLYRAVDKVGQTIEFMLSAKRDVTAAKRKGQVKKLAGGDAQGQAKFVQSLFGVAAKA